MLLLAAANLTAVVDEARTAVSTKDLDKLFRKYSRKLGMDNDGSASLEQVRSHPSTQRAMPTV